jgi:hypothetical protein
MGAEVGQAFANQIRRRLPRAGDKWHLDEVAVKIAREKHWLWRAVDQDGVVLDVLVQRRRDKAQTQQSCHQGPFRSGAAGKGCRETCRSSLDTRDRLLRHQKWRKSHWVGVCCRTPKMRDKARTSAGFVTLPAQMAPGDTTVGSRPTRPPRNACCASCSGSRVARLA